MTEASPRKPWKVSEFNLVKGLAKQRQGEDRARADAWRKVREAELEAVVDRTYDGMDIPEIRELVTKLQELAQPFIAEFDRLFRAHYPAEFARARLTIGVSAGGIPEPVREKVRRDAAQHLAARHAFMLANSSGYVTETLSDATMKTTDNPEVREALEKLAVPNRATPTLEPPGPAIGMLARLLPHPEEWGLDGYGEVGSPLLAGPDPQLKLAPPDPQK